MNLVSFHTGKANDSILNSFFFFSFHQCLLRAFYMSGHGEMMIQGAWALFSSLHAKGVFIHSTNIYKLEACGWFRALVGSSQPALLGAIGGGPAGAKGCRWFAGQLRPWSGWWWCLLRDRTSRGEGPQVFWSFHHLVNLHIILSLYRMATMCQALF